MWDKVVNASYCSTSRHSVLTLTCVLLYYSLHQRVRKLRLPAQVTQQRLEEEESQHREHSENEKDSERWRNVNVWWWVLLIISPLLLTYSLLSPPTRHFLRIISPTPHALLIISPYSSCSYYLPYSSCSLCLTAIILILYYIILLDYTSGKYNIPHYTLQDENIHGI